MSNSNPYPPERAALEVYMTVANALKVAEVAESCGHHFALGNPDIKRAVQISSAFAGHYAEIMAQRH